MVALDARRGVANPFMQLLAGSDFVLRAVSLLALAARLFAAVGLGETPLHARLWVEVLVVLNVRGRVDRRWSRDWSRSLGSVRRSPRGSLASLTD